MSKKFKIIILTVLISNFSFLISHSANAQAAPEFLVSWQAQSYVPIWYQGKVFPTYGSRVDVKFELIDNGKIADLSKAKIRWYVNDDLTRNENNGLGIKNYSFVNSSVYGGNDLEVKVSIVDYKGKSLDKIIAIPVKSPEAIIEAPYLDNGVDKGKSAFFAWPFFFGIPNNFSIKWMVDGNEANGSSANSPILSLNIDSGTLPKTIINLKAQIQNLSNQMEIAEKLVPLEVK